MDVIGGWLALNASGGTWITHLLTFKGGRFFHIFDVSSIECRCYGWWFRDTLSLVAPLGGNNLRI